MNNAQENTTKTEQARLESVFQRLRNAIKKGFVSLEDVERFTHECDTFYWSAANDLARARSIAVAGPLGGRVPLLLEIYRFTREECDASLLHRTAETMYIGDPDQCDLWRTRAFVLAGNRSAALRTADSIEKAETAFSAFLTIIKVFSDTTAADAARHFVPLILDAGERLKAACTLSAATRGANPKDLAYVEQCRKDCLAEWGLAERYEWLSLRALRMWLRLDRLTEAEKLLSEIQNRKVYSTGLLDIAEHTRSAEHVRQALQVIQTHSLMDFRTLSDVVYCCLAGTDLPTARKLASWATNALDRFRLFARIAHTEGSSSKDAEAAKTLYDLLVDSHPNVPATAHIELMRAQVHHGNMEGARDTITHITEPGTLCRGSLLLAAQTLGITFEMPEDRVREI